MSKNRTGKKMHKNKGDKKYEKRRKKESVDGI
jgi:hypothetical protein